MSEQDQSQLNIEISEEIAEGQYANLAIITHSHAEFVLDFVNVMPGTPKSRVKSRIILTPQHAKRLMKALKENLEKFEHANGFIKDLEEVQMPMHFGLTSLKLQIPCIRNSVRPAFSTNTVLAYLQETRHCLPILRENTT